MNKKIKIMFFTGNRAEFGLLAPIIKEVTNTINMEYRLIVSGAHLNTDYGKTIKEIKDESLIIHHKINVIKNKITKEVAQIICEVSNIINLEKPDYFFVLGDRVETYAAATAAFLCRVPIAHEGGGTITNGGCLDDSLRHAITKLASLHFVTCKVNYNNLKKLGEEEWRICLSGSTAVDTVINEELYSRSQLEKSLNIDLDKPLILFTQHPVMDGIKKENEKIKQSLTALKNIGYQTLITYPNSDPGSEQIIKEYLNNQDVDNFIFIRSLGRKRYLSVMKYCSVVVGNSSSGLLETPIFKIPAVNIGNRQKGRVRSTNIIDVGYNSIQIENAIKKSILDKNYIKEVSKCLNPFGKGNASKKIVQFLDNNSDTFSILNKKLV